ncbi:MAG: hypothetical protein AAFO82_16450, partial [Bacteroidota bacterium]
MEQAQKELKELQVTRKEAEEKQQHWSQDLATSRANQAKVQQNIQTLERWLKEHKYLEPATKDLAQLELYQVQMEELQKSIDELEQEQLGYEEQLLAQEKQLKLAQQKLKNAEDLLAEDDRAFINYAPKYYKIDFKTRANWLQESTKHLSQMQLYSNKLEDLVNIVEQVEEKQQTWKAEQDQLAILKEQLLVSNKRLEEFKAEVRANKRHYELERAVKNYERERKNLKEGEPCPLCGSKEHPFCEGDWSSDYIDEAKLRLEKAEQALEKEQAYWNNLSQQQQGVLTKVEVFEQEVLRLQNQIEPLQKAIEAMPIAQKPKDFSHKTLKETIVSYQKHLEEEKVRQATAQEIDSRMQIQESKKAEAQTQLLSLRQSFQNFTTQFKSQQNQLKAWKIDLAKNTEASDQLFQKYPLQSIENPITELRERHQEFLRKQKSFEQKSQELKTLGQKIEITQKQVNEQTLQLQKYQERIQNSDIQVADLQMKRRGLFGEKNPKQERQALIQKLEDTEQNTQKIQADFHEITQKLATTQANLEAAQNQLTQTKKEGKKIQESLVA